MSDADVTGRFLGHDLMMTDVPGAPALDGARGDAGRGRDHGPCRGGRRDGARRAPGHPTVGRFSVPCDPDGAVFAPSREIPGCDDAPEVGDISWHELVTADHARGFAFHRALFGWEVDHDLDLASTAHTGSAAPPARRSAE
jgi:hypothetical protein